MAVILPLIINYFVLKIVSYSHTTTRCNSHKENHPQDTLIVSQAPKDDIHMSIKISINVISLQL